jgi:hypothetical protein
LLASSVSAMALNRRGLFQDLWGVFSCLNCLSEKLQFVCSLLRNEYDPCISKASHQSTNPQAISTFKTAGITTLVVKITDLLH